ncbi:MAG: metallophosphoesterase [Chthoniobacteraceae bacterium]
MIDKSPFWQNGSPVNRRKFIRVTTRAVAGSMLAGGIYSAVEAKEIQVTRFAVALPNLPRAFHGKTVAFLSDIHHSIVVPRSYIEHVVNLTNSLSPDIVILGGDYVTSGPKYGWLHGATYIESCFDMLKKLTSKLGCFAVTGNHDMHVGIEKIYAAIAGTGIRNINNTGVWLTLDGQRMRICGVEDLRTQKPDVKLALGDATDKDAVILVSHNPDVAEQKIEDARVGFTLSGHTHGGQVVLPFIGAPIVGLCSDYGQKYRYGMVQGPRCGVYVTSGVGTLPPAFRLNCYPEVALITLTSPFV